GFARRFSSYKRAFLLFKDIARLKRLINNPDMPVQIIMAGKAHPLDNPGKEIIKQILQVAAQEEFRKRIIFLEDYDINVARYLVQGVDVWLNNPRRPQEASGTSGMKAAVNGALNLSILDGWWCEGYTPETGFKIGNGEEYDNPEYQDSLENQFLFDALEREVIPLFYKTNGANLPYKWVAMMKSSIAMAGGHFSSHRMVKNYTDQAYIPAINAYNKFSADNHTATKTIAKWQTELTAKWDQINIDNIETPAFENSPKVGDKIPVTLKVTLGDLKPDDLIIEIIGGNLNSLEQMNNYESVVAEKLGVDATLPRGQYLYKAEVVCKESGRFGIAARVMPRNPNLIHNKIPKLIKWW
ncbi:MAG: alpha-glucan family phosphorylase, partial [candidate division Zixibacteria bacterium]|nr:alpha-glucan family phosphorylase [candidate division Zixibacteria bacterium]